MHRDLNSGNQQNGIHDTQQNSDRLPEIAEALFPAFLNETIWMNDVQGNSERGKSVAFYEGCGSKFSDYFELTA